MDADEADDAAMSCEAARTRLSACRDGEAEAGAALARHLAACDDCRRFERQLARLVRQFEAWRATPLQDEAARLAAIEARLRDGVAPLRRLPGRAVALRVAASFVGLALVALPAWLDARRRGREARRGAEEPAWLAPLTGGALAPGDAPLAAWQPLMAAALEGARAEGGGR